MPFIPSAALLSNQGGYFPVGTAARYVAATGGSDGNDGLSPKTAMATISGAYTSLPSKGGDIILLDGVHNVGAGVTFTHPKYVNLISIQNLLSGWNTNVQAGYDKPMPLIVGTSGTFLIKAGSDGVSIANGFSFEGIAFNTSGASTIVSAILANDCNFMRVRDCNFDDDGGAKSETAYAIRATQPSFDDSSWFRIQDNRCRQIGLCSLNDEAVDGNCNNNQILDNVVFGHSGFAIRLFNAQRTMVTGNNLEGSGCSGIQYRGSSHYNYTIGNGGEGTISPYLQYDSGSWGNIDSNFGSPAGAVIVNDLDAANAFASGSYSLVTSTNGYAESTVDYTMTAGRWDGSLVDMNKATAITFTVPLQATIPIPIGARVVVRQKGAGTVTISPSGGVTLDGPTTTAAQYSVVFLQKVDVNVWDSYRGGS